jgi:hypothetical protein
MAEEVILRISPEGGFGADQVSPNGGSSQASRSGGMLGGIGKLVGLGSIIAGGIQAGLSVLSSIFDAFKPVLSVLQAIGKTLSVFLQPIAEMLTYLLQPLLDVLTPMSLMFNALMGPVMNLVREYSNVMSQQVASGDTQGAASTSMNMISLIFQGFFLSLADVVGKIIIDTVGNLLKKTTTGIISVIEEVMVGVVSIFSKSKAEEIRQNAADLKLAIGMSFDESIEKTKTTLTDGVSIMMEDLITSHEEKLNKIKDNMPSTINNSLDIGVVQPIEGTMSNTKASMPIVIEDTLDKGVGQPMKEAFRSMRNDIEDYFDDRSDKSINSKFRKGLDSIRNDMDDFVDDIEDSVDEFNDAVNSFRSGVKKATFGLIG